MNSDVLNTLVMAARGASETLAPGASDENRKFAKRLLDDALTLVKIDAECQKRKDPDFDGETYDPAYDKNRLKRQLGRVFETMRGGLWRSLSDIEHSLRSTLNVSVSEASISARLRDLRKKQHGGYIVERRARDRAKGLFEYRLLSAGGGVIGWPSQQLHSRLGREEEATEDGRA